MLSIESLYAVIMAGGRGERFWPLSTDKIAKPFVPLLGERTLLQSTVDRLHSLVPRERIFISIGENHREVATRQLPEIPPENFVVEPIGRDTSACLGFCALHLERRDADALMLAVPADHYVDSPERYGRSLKKAIENLEGSTAVLFGVPPARPETGYGYIQAEKPAVPADAWPVVRFVEKPDLATAASYVRSGEYFWNSGIFLWRNRTLLELFEEHMPATHQGLSKIRPLLGRKDATSEIFPIFASLERISIDYGILEQASRLRMVPVEFVWDDIGNWAALERVLPADALGNISRGAHLAVESSACIVYSDAGLIATFGVSNLAVVQAAGKVLVCPKDRASDLKRLVSALGPDANR